MTVLQNVEYGLRVKKVAKADDVSARSRPLASVQLAGFEDRKPAQMSGGQRQRVALARALVNRPRVLLLDEPLGALDLKLREQMQVELKQLQRQVGITFVFVTHDQEEALTMSDRIAVFNAGRIEQVGTPAEVYEQPGDAVRRGLRRHLEPAAGRRQPSRSSGTTGVFSVRPEKIRIANAHRPPPARASTRAAGVVREVVYVGAATRFVVDLEVGGYAGRPAAERADLLDGRAWTCADDRCSSIWRREHETAVG